MGKVNMDNLYEKCIGHGLLVERDGDWIWLNGTDGRYTENEEYKLFRDLGFRYSRKRRKFYHNGLDDRNNNKWRMERKLEAKKKREDIGY